MSDQTQPKLSLEEELDVLEAVYKVGKEKGLDLLRPEQVKKLRDAGRIQIDVVERQTEKVKDRPAIAKQQLSREQAQFILMGLRLKLRGELQKIMAGVEEWNVFTDKQKAYALDCYFRYAYGLSDESLLSVLVNGSEDGA